MFYGLILYVYIFLLSFASTYAYLHECTQQMCSFVYLGNIQKSNLADATSRLSDQTLLADKRAGQHGLELLLVRPQSHLPGCGWEGAKGR